MTVTGIMMPFEDLKVFLICTLVVISNVTAEDRIEKSSTNSTSEFDELIATQETDEPVNITNNLQFSSDKQLEDSLYESIYYNNFDKAIEQSRGIIKQGRQHVIKSTVDYLIQHKRPQTTPFAYKLWAAGYGDVVKTQFPEEFQMVFSDNAVRLTNYWYHVPIELGEGRSDSQYDKQVVSNAEEPYGDSFLWKLEPATYKDKIYFKIRHFKTNRYMKLGEHIDFDGDYLAYAAIESNTERHLWLLQPVKHDGIYLFFIINLHHYQALKVSHRMSYGIRTVFGVRVFDSDIAKYGFRVKVLKK